MSGKNNGQNLDSEEKYRSIGFHEGAISTLVKEREELLKTLNVVNQLIKLHVNALSELGVNLESKDSSADNGKNYKKSSSVDSLFQ